MEGLTTLLSTNFYLKKKSNLPQNPAKNKKTNPGQSASLFIPSFHQRPDPIGYGQGSYSSLLKLDS